MSAHNLSEEDVEDFNAALSLTTLAAWINTPDSVDDAVHLRNLCRVASSKLVAIRNRLDPEGIQLGGGL